MNNLYTPEIKGKLSLLTSITGEIAMDGVPVPEDNLLPQTNVLFELLTINTNSLVE